MLRAGLIGCGNISKAHTGGYAQIAEEKGGVVLEAVCDIRPEQLECFDDSVRKYTSVEEMLEKEQGKLDYVDICVPTYLHSQIAIQAMEAGFNVLSEKPMARTVEQAEAMVEASKRTGKMLMIGHCCRFYSVPDLIRETIASGELGKVRSAEFYREGGSKNPMGWNNWFRDGELSGGAMLDLHIHDVDVIREFFGMPKAVSAVASSVITKNGYDAMSVNYTYEDGKFVHALCDWTIANDKFNTRTVRVNFEKGYIFGDRTKGREALVKVHEDGTVEDYTETMTFNAHKNEIVYFVDCLSKGKFPDRCPPEQSVDDVKIVMAEMRSADLGGALVEV